MCIYSTRNLRMEVLAKEAFNKIIAERLCGVYILYAHWNEYDWYSIGELIYFPIYYLLSHFEHLNYTHQSKSKGTSNKLNILNAKLFNQTIKEFLRDEYMLDVIYFYFSRKQTKLFCDMALKGTANKKSFRNFKENNKKKTFHRNSFIQKSCGITLKLIMCVF